MTCRIDGSECTVGEGTGDGSARWCWAGQPRTHVSNLEDVAHGEVLKREPTNEKVLSNVARTNRMTFRTQGVQHLMAPHTQGTRWAAVMLQIALTIAQATVRPDGKKRHRRFGHATFGSGVKRDNARFGDHWSHSA
jgi:predicted hydrolase (HD superfamily)